MGKSKYSGKACIRGEIFQELIVTSGGIDSRSEVLPISDCSNFQTNHSNTLKGDTVHLLPTL